MPLPGLVPLPRHLGGRRLLLASLTGSKRRGNLIHGARPRAVASSSWRTSSPAHVPDWEREEGRLRPQPWPRAVASSSRWMSSHVTMTCSFHQVLQVEYPPGIFFNNPLSDRTNAQYNLGFRPMDTVHYVHLCISVYHCVSIRYISALFFGCPFCRSSCSSTLQSAE